MAYIGTKLKDGPGMTTCRTCHRALYKKDADKNGDCCDCNGTAVEPTEQPVFKSVPASEVA